ncbi:PstS family phosphate ABC transporter substrate-binding protein [Anabaena sp. PCC 7938]|uniref:Phosphate-binding protein n=1 Tax=Anabaena cylindrica (strain ATCC 27899 / PCC 7122) TaxID=272123 RepID=K9ZIG1_ANACC|nr:MULTISPECIES: PstS family phosphate ABC transporter substrate-binding protein [Anabaena]AFZ58554.1 phosphate ABC transporter substrate-binding protein, PhoT family [Anabaena cylindrica PCC 7122]MBY5283913.1 PstS family phosphate ABC transporter substrate-binding protein [Anabaena sp. CCAP 1446/1C]MBY5306711.1 PstS family phosphate ABC transporter substrate-binding protein [Anabaena sp. CCAP 1446/1C]MCM2407302.1 PstS family phosphate ABC transporter substrate-binding protein [Anabaena sp. CCA
MNKVNIKLNSLKALGVISLMTATLGVSMSAVQSQSVSTIKIDGSSTVFPVTEAVAEEFQKSQRGKVRVTVGVSGTGGGFKKFCRGETDISNASRPILQKEIDECKKAGIRYIEIPVAYDALTVVINPGNTWAKNLTVAELKKIWEPGAQGKINNWNQVRAGFPNAPLKLFGAGTNSGTFDYFTEAIVGKSKSSRGDFTASEDDNVLVQGVARDKNALGYFGFAYYSENKDKLKSVSVNGVAPSETTVKNGTYNPLSRPIFIYVSNKAADKPEVKQFVQFYLRNASKLVKEVKYVALPGSAYTTAQSHFNKKRFGSIFGGKEAVGLKIDELIRRDAKE